MIGDNLFDIVEIQSDTLRYCFSEAFYGVWLWEASAEFEVDSVSFQSEGRTILFLTPFQKFRWRGTSSVKVQRLSFHADFYCIEYHKREVACNGLLFNSIYMMPQISVSPEFFSEIQEIIRKMQQIQASKVMLSESILKSYLQLLLALCSSEKSKQLSDQQKVIVSDEKIIQFQELMEIHFRTQRSIQFYAGLLSVSSAVLTRKAKSHFGKTPMQLIRERVILEAKKLLHLTQKTIKEIAFELHFEDEFYFSRYFKKVAGVSPLGYRQQVGISEVTKKSIK